MTFDVVFGAFVAAMLVIAVLVFRWAAGLHREARRPEQEQQSGDARSAD